MILGILLCAMVVSASAEEGLETGNSSPVIPPAHEPSDDSYFSDAVFVGDSMMDDIDMLDLFPTGHFVCLIGMSPLSAPRKQFHVSGSTELFNAYEATAAYEHAKIYILIGSNSLDHKTSNDSLSDYAVMLDQFLTCFPDSTIYLISPPPMTWQYMKENSLSPVRIKNFRDGLLMLAREKQCYFIDFYSAIANEDGYLPDQLDCGDGIHPSPKGLKTLEQFIRCHTVN